MEALHDSANVFWLFGYFFFSLPLLHRVLVPQRLHCWLPCVLTRTVPRQPSIKHLEKIQKILKNKIELVFSVFFRNGDGGAGWSIYASITVHQRFKSRTLSGAQELRLEMGHCLTGGNIIYGTGVFITISPSERHSGLALRLLRKRARDPWLRYGEPNFKALMQKLAAADYPS